MSLTDISGIIGQTGAALEHQALSSFGAAVSNQAGELLSGLFSGITGSSSMAASPKGVNAHWSPTPYSAAIANGAGNYDPKTKFLFKISFEFYDSLSPLAQSLHSDKLMDVTKDTSFVIKQIDLPKYDFEYEEFNFYNFRSKVLKKISHQELNFIMYDDVANHALDFFNTYMMMLVPVSRQDRDPTMSFEDHGFAFTQDVNAPDSSMRTALGNTEKQLIRKLSIVQYYLVRSATGSTINAHKANTYVFTNPRLTHFDMNDQDFDNADAPSVISAKFDFDSMNLITGRDATYVDSHMPSLPTGDILMHMTPAATAAAKGSSAQKGNSKNPFISILANAGQRIIQTQVSSLLTKSLKGIPGGGQIAGILSSAVGNPLAMVANNTISSVGNGALNTISVAAKSLVKDSSTPSASIPVLSNQVSS